jgi:hypothetical protein
MKTVTLEVAALKDVKRRAREAFKGKRQGVRDGLSTARRARVSSPVSAGSAVFCPDSGRVSCRFQLFLGRRGHEWRTGCVPWRRIAR